MHTEEEGGDVEHRAIFMSNIIKIWRLSIYMLPEDLLSARSLAQQPLLLFLLSGSRGRWREQAEMNESNNPTVRREREQRGGPRWCKHQSESLQVYGSIFTMAQGKRRRRKKGMRGGKRKWYENGSSALFMDPTEECGWWLVMVVVSQSSRACLYLCTYEYTD